MFLQQKIIYRICGYIIPKYQRKFIFVQNLNRVNGCLNQCSVRFTAHGHNVATQEIQESQKPVIPVNKFVLRSHTCGELTIKNVGDTVKLCGWLEFHRMAKFIVLHDSYGSTQFVVPDDRYDLKEIIKDLSYGCVLSIEGKVIPRPKGQENPNMKTGYIEIQVESLNVMNTVSEKLPFITKNFKGNQMPKESLLMQYRYLSLRYHEIQTNLRLRSQFVAKLRQYLIDECGFVDVETPTLFRKTPGGAQEFIVPTRNPGYFYTLVQSPQQFKQLLMVGGLDRYFQIARCYRDEKGSDKQPEFTQLDIEMSFTDRDGVIALIESLLMYSWPSESKLSVPFKRITYAEAMELYGTDQPDLRIPYQLQNLTEIVDFSCLKHKSIDNECTVAAIVFPQKHEQLTNTVMKQFGVIKDNNFSGTTLVQLKIYGDKWTSKLNTIFSDNISEHIKQKLDIAVGDALFIAIGDKKNVEKLLGKIRVEFTNILESKGQTIRSTKNELLWIIDFPMFSRNNSGALEIVHHPFTQPHPEDIQYLTTDPTKVKSLHYDLVMNGSEIGGGSIRIHDVKLQEQILEMLKVNKSELEHMLKALGCGAPPHGGIALGLDRLICLLCNAPSIRSVIAFPKTVEGRDLMSNTPSTISNEDEILYHIKTSETNVAD